jgi:hypothetical protein
VEEDKEPSQVLPLDPPGGVLESTVLAQLNDLVTEHNDVQHRPVPHPREEPPGAALPSRAGSPTTTTCPASPSPSVDQIKGIPENEGKVLNVIPLYLVLLLQLVLF